MASCRLLKLRRQACFEHAEDVFADMHGIGSRRGEHDLLEAMVQSTEE